MKKKACSLLLALAIGLSLAACGGGTPEPAPKKPAPITGVRKGQIFKGDAAASVASLVEALKKDGHDFTVGIPIDTPIAAAERVVSAGKGIGSRENMRLIEELAKAAAADRSAGHRRKAARAAHGQNEAPAGPGARAHRSPLCLRRLRL